MGSSDRLLRDEVRAYYCLDLAEQLIELQAGNKLLELLEKGYLVEQARFTNGLAEVVRTLRDFAMPAASQCGDMVLFLKYGAALLHALRLGDALTEESLLHVLLGSAGDDLALAAMGRFADPYALGRACAFLFDSRPQSSERMSWLDRARDALLLWFEEGRPRSGENAIVDILSILGPELEDSWTPGLEENDTRLHAAAARGFLKSRPLTSPGLWRHLACCSLEETPELADRLATRWLEAGASRPEAVWGPLRTLISEVPEVGWPLLAGLNGAVSCQAETLERPAISGRAIVELSLDLAVEAMPSSEQLWRGRALFGQWTDHDIESRDLQSSREVMMTLHVARTAVSGKGCPARRRQTLSFLSQVDDAARWRRTASRIALTGDQNAASTHWLTERLIGSIIVDGVAPKVHDALDELSAVVRIFPRRAHLVLRKAFVKAGSKELLRQLAERLEPSLLGDVFVDEVETLALLVSHSQLEAFQLRRELIDAVAQRLLVGTGQPTAPWQQLEARLDEIRRHLLLEEWRDSMLRLASEVTSRQRASWLIPFFKKRACPRAATLLELRFETLPASATNPETPVTLLRAASTVARLEDELSALEVLASVPADADLAAERLATTVHDEEIRQMGLMRYASRAMEQETLGWKKLSDHRSVLLGVQRALVSSSPERLATLMPLLVDIGGKLGDHYAASEAIEGLLQIASTTSLELPARLEALEDLMVSIAGAWCLEPPTRNRGHTAGRILARLLRIPLAWPANEIAETNSVPSENTEPWGPDPQLSVALRLWPLAVAFLEVLPPTWRGSSAPWPYRLKGALSRSRVQRPWWRVQLEKQAASRSAPDARLSTLLKLCQGSNSRRRSILQSTLREKPDDQEIIAAALLLASVHTQSAYELEHQLGALPRGHRRDRLLLSVAHVAALARRGTEAEPQGIGCLASDAIENTVMTLAGSDQSAALILLSVSSDTARSAAEAWRRALKVGALDPADPRLEGTLARLRDDPAEFDRRAIEAAITASAHRGPVPLELGLRVYLHHCFTRLSSPDQATWTDLRKALRASSDLSFRHE